MKNKTIKRRFIIIIAAYAVIIIAMWSLYQNTVFSYIHQNQQETISLAGNNLLRELDDEFSRMTLVSSVLSGSVYVQEFLSETDTMLYYEKAEAVSEIVRKTTYPHLSTDSIITITESGAFYRFTGGISNSAIEKIQTEALRSGEASYSVIELDGTGYFCLVTPVYSRGSEIKPPVGYIVTLSGVSKIRRTLLDLHTESGIDTAVILNDLILLSSNTELDGKSVPELYEIYGSVTISQVTGSNLLAAIAITNDTIEYAQRLFLVIAIITFAVLFITLVLLYRLLSSKTITPMLEKADTMKIGLLKTQISAHFIVNTIDCIESLAEQGELEKTASAAKNLSGMLRTLHESDEEINVYEQLEHLNHYIEIMNIRAGGKYNIVIDVDDRLVEYKIPAHILQPLAENALTHGLGNKSSDCQLSIIGRLVNDAIVFEVSDNGKGIDNEAALKIKEALETADELEYAEHSLQGIALLNIQRRIHTRYGRDYGLLFNGVLGRGVTVTVRLPLIMDN